MWDPFSLNSMNEIVRNLILFRVIVHFHLLHSPSCIIEDRRLLQLEQLNKVTRKIYFVSKTVDIRIRQWTAEKISDFTTNWITASFSLDQEMESIWRRCRKRKRERNGEDIEWIDETKKKKSWMKFAVFLPVCWLAPFQTKDFLFGYKTPFGALIHPFFS